MRGGSKSQHRWRAEGNIGREESQHLQMHCYEVLIQLRI